MPGRRSDDEARQTRARIVRHAARMASERGLEGISIGTLAADLGMSKAGIIGPFGTKEELQLATLQYAIDVFVERVWAPAQAASPGIDRLEAICDTWTRYNADPPLPGGCFIAAAVYEWDSRPGRIRDALQASSRSWTALLVREITTAVAAGDLPRSTDPEQLAYTLEALADAATPARLLDENDRAIELSRRAMRASLGRS